MSVVGNDFEALKQYNLAEIYNPSQRPTTPQAERIENAENAGKAEITEKAEDSNDAKPNSRKKGEMQGEMQAS